MDKVSIGFTFCQGNISEINIKKVLLLLIMKYRNWI